MPRPTTRAKIATQTTRSREASRQDAETRLIPTTISQAATTVKTRPRRSVQKAKQTGHSTPAQRVSERQPPPRSASDHRDSIKSAAQIVAEELQKAALADDGATTTSPPSVDATNGTRTAPDRPGISKVRSSMGALAEFQRRKRQPSLLAMVQQTRPVDNSVATESQIAENVTAADTTALAFDTSVEDILAGFQPDNVSTPVNAVRSQPIREGSGRPDEVRAAGDNDLYGCSPLPKRTSRKRKSDELDGPDPSEIQVPRSPDFGPPSVRTEGLYNRHEPAAEAIPSTEPTENRRDGSPGEELSSDDVYADPMSSSPPASQPPRMQPGRTAGRCGKPSQQKSLITTADLRVLLPRRRHTSRDDTARDDIDAESSPGLKEITGKRRRAVSTRNATLKATKGKASSGNYVSTKVPGSKGKSHPRKPISLDSSDKENGPASSPPPPSSSPGLPSHGRRRKDNTTAIPSSPTQPSDEGAEDHELTPRPKKGEDLRVAAEKFREIDRWDLEFESAPSLGERAGHGPRHKSASARGKKTGKRTQRVGDEVGRCSSGAEWR